ncbi:hypothetical protein K1719_026651 [Acacia pycnantha]|nr:hypothetical protein K1719_026651 [Acacia pycnantha]
MAALAAGSVTTGDSLSATWRLLWTTEKEQLFIIEKAYLFGTQAGDVLQVIDVQNSTLNNVITFPPDGVFFVRSNIEIASSQRVNFRFTSAVLRGKNWEFPLPPFGQGWFDTVYLDDDIRVVKDIRGDYLVVDRAPYTWKERSLSVSSSILHFYCKHSLDEVLVTHFSIVNWAPHRFPRYGTMALYSNDD